MPLSASDRRAWTAERNGHASRSRRWSSPAPAHPSRRLAVPQLEIAGARFQHMARDAEQLFPDDASGADKRPRDHYRIAAAPGASTGETVVGVGIGDADVGGINL